MVIEASPVGALFAPLPAITLNTQEAIMGSIVNNLLAGQPNGSPVSSFSSEGRGLMPLLRFGVSIDADLVAEDTTLVTIFDASGFRIKLRFAEQF